VTNLKTSICIKKKETRGCANRDTMGQWGKMRRWRKKRKRWRRKMLGHGERIGCYHHHHHPYVQVRIPSRTLGRAGGVVCGLENVGDRAQTKPRCSSPSLPLLPNGPKCAGHAPPGSPRGRPATGAGGTAQGRSGALGYEKANILLIIETANPQTSLILSERT